MPPVHRFPHRRFLPTVLLLIALSSPAAPAPAADPREVADVVPSAVLGEEVPITVYLPASYGEADRRYPCLFLLEPDLYWRAVTGIVDAWSRLGAMPELIVVGVGTADRWRDFTPTTAGVPGGAVIAASGGGARYGEFLATELVPAVERAWRCEPFRILCGHSLAGLEVIAAGLARPDLFGAGIATSPSLWWDAETVTASAARILAADPQRGGILFLASGDEDETIQAPLRRFGEVLREHASSALRWTRVRYPAASHPQVPLAAFGEALSFVFGGWGLPAAAWEGGLAAVEAHFAALTARYGYRIAVPEAVLNRLGYRALAAGEHDQALALFRRNVREHPGSANAHDSLAEGLLAVGDTAGARLGYERALALDPESPSARAALERLGG